MVRRLNHFKYEDFFLDFIKGPPLQLTVGDCAIKLSVLKLCLRDQITFEVGLLIGHALHFQVFNATDNLKAIRAIYKCLGLNEYFTELKIGDKSLFCTFLRKYFATIFTFNWSAGLNSAS